MIPQRMLSSEIYRSGLRDRVTACRKRLRDSRTKQKSLTRDEEEELFPETNAIFSFKSREPQDGETLVLAREPEVESRERSRSIALDGR
jgi:hypothetical protein